MRPENDRHYADNQLQIAARLNEVDADVVDTRACAIATHSLVCRVAEKLGLEVDARDLPPQRERAISHQDIEEITDSIGREVVDAVREGMPRPSPTPLIEKLELERYRQLKTFIFTLLAGAGSVGLWEFVKHLFHWTF